MTSQNLRLPRYFYRMPPRPCPYIPGRIEQNIFTELVASDGPEVYDVLTHAGFRRSHGIAYRPACEGCQACVPVRVVVDGFRMSRSLRRVANMNQDVRTVERPADATSEQYRLFSRYVRGRHHDGEMADMSFSDYAAMIEDSPLPTFVDELRDTEGTLLGACLVDRVSDGLSAVYSFFEPTENQRSVGTLIVLRLVERARALHLPYVYLGYWIAESRKMAYKMRFQPLEAPGPEGWTLFTPDEKSMEFDEDDQD